MLYYMQSNLLGVCVRTSKGTLNLVRGTCHHLVDIGYMISIMYVHLDHCFMYVYVRTGYCSVHIDHCSVHAYVRTSYCSVRAYVRTSYCSVHAYVRTSYCSVRAYVRTSYCSVRAYVRTSYCSVRAYVHTSYCSVHAYVRTYRSLLCACVCTYRLLLSACVCLSYDIFTPYYSQAYLVSMHVHTTAGTINQLINRVSFQTKLSSVV